MMALNLHHEEPATHCHSSNCSWLYLSNLTALLDVPPLLPNPELSGIGVVLGFSISAYLTIVLLILHYVTVHDFRHINVKGSQHSNFVDQSVLTFIRGRLILWKPSKRFRYAMERSVLVLSDLNLVTGIGLLSAAYSQINCGISAYHWQIMVFEAWFASFSFVSTMTFLNDYLKGNKSMKFLRVLFICVLGALLITALLPTGSSMWLNVYPNDSEGFYPSLSTLCFYKELNMGRFRHQSSKLWSMAFSVVIMVVSFARCILRLILPTAGKTCKYVRQWSGSKLKRLIYFFEQKSMGHHFHSHVFHIPYLSLYALFITLRASFDIAESMLLEIIWLTFAMAWGTIKIWTTRRSAIYSFDGMNYSKNQELLEEDNWTFGQTLPLILLLLPLLSMAQAYLDNDAKAHGMRHRLSRIEDERHELTIHYEMRTMHEAEQESSHTPHPTTRNNNTQLSAHYATTGSKPIHPQSSSQIPFNIGPRASNTLPATPVVHLPTFPYPSFTSQPWYYDHILLLLCQILMVSCFALWVLTAVDNVFGIAAILRNRIFLTWTLGIMPFASMLHLGSWYIAALVVCQWPGAWEWLTGQGTSMGAEEGARWWRNITAGQVVWCVLRLGLVAACLAGTFFGSIELAGPEGIKMN